MNLLFLYAVYSLFSWHSLQGWFFLSMLNMYSILSILDLPCSCYHYTVFRTKEEICFVKSSIHTHRYTEMYTTWWNQPEVKYFDLFTLSKKHRFLCLRGRRGSNLYWMSNILCRATHWCVKWKGMKSIRIEFPWKMSGFQNKEGKELRGPCAISCQT